MRSFSRIRRAELATSALGLFLVLCISPLAHSTPDAFKCKAPAELERRVKSHSSAAAYDELGVYFGQGDHYACAISAFRTSLRLNPKSWQTHSYLGLALLASGAPEPAA